MFIFEAIMKLEQSIRQTKPFKSEMQKLLINIQVTASWLNNLFAAHLKQFGITPAQYNVLRILRGRYPNVYNNQDITERMIDKSSNCTRIIDKLVVKGLVLRSENENDRRHVSIKITAKGLALLKEIEVRNENEKLFLKPLTDKKARLMNLWLDELRD